LKSEQTIETHAETDDLTNIFMCETRRYGYI